MAWVRRYRVFFCLVIVAACSGIVRNINGLNQLTLLGTGCMLWSNIPITVVFAKKAMDSQREYRRRFG